MCIPTRDERGMQSEVFDHFGSAPFFTLVDSESGQVVVKHNTNVHHGHGGCHPLRQFGLQSIDAVVCQAMGRKAVASLKEAGVQVFVLDEDAGRTVQSVVAAAREERLKPFSENDACQGRGHGHGPGGCHGNGSGPGRRRGGRA
jgi:predicted Fe-Mo cluster-binding NifX family protein